MARGFHLENPTPSEVANATKVGSVSERKPFMRGRSGSDRGGLEGAIKREQWFSAMARNFIRRTQPHREPPTRLNWALKANNSGRRPNPLSWVTPPYTTFPFEPSPAMTASSTPWCTGTGDDSFQYTMMQLVMLATRFVHHVWVLSPELSRYYSRTGKFHPTRR